MATYQQEILEKSEALKDYDEPIRKIARYVKEPLHKSEEAQDTAAFCLLDSMACLVAGLKTPGISRILGGTFEGEGREGPVRIPGTDYKAHPLSAAFQIGSLIRWLDYNDTFLAKEWGHPSDNLGALLSAAEYLKHQGKTITIADLLEYLIKAYEIQGTLALENSFNRFGFDHVILVKAASAAVSASMLGGDEKMIASALSNAFADAGPLRCYRHYPNTGSRKSWAAGDASSRGLFFAGMALKGEMGYPTVLSAKKWGLSDTVLQGAPLSLSGDMHTYIVENILFKVSFPAEFHAQTAVESAIRLHKNVKDRLDEIKAIEIETHEAAIRIIDKRGPLKNFADRDHCLQYMVAVGLLKGELKAADYEDEFAKNPWIDRLRNLMTVKENERFSKEYHEKDKRSIANSVKVVFNCGTSIKEEFDYPLGHRKRREEAKPRLLKKAHDCFKDFYSEEKIEKIVALFHDRDLFLKMPVGQWIDLFIKR